MTGTELASKLNVSYETIRRWSHTYKDFLSNQDGRKKSYNESDISILEAISTMSAKGLVSREIKPRLHNNHSQYQICKNCNTPVNPIDFDPERRICNSCYEEVKNKENEKAIKPKFNTATIPAIFQALNELNQQISKLKLDNDNLNARLSLLEREIIK